MKASELLYLAGIKPSPKRYGSEVRTFHLENDGEVNYAKWLHPYEREKRITQQSVNELRKFLRPGDVAVDIGAHTGDSTIPMALAVGITGCVLALEPNGYVFPVLQQNAGLNPDKTRIIPLCYAATPADGEFEFSYSDRGFCNGGSFEGMSVLLRGHPFKLKIQGRNLCRLLDQQFPELIDQIRYIKIDAEGYDLTIIESIADLLRKNRPYLKCEVYKRLSFAQRKNLFQTLKELGYTIHKVEGDESYSGEVITESNLTKWRHYDVFCAFGGDLNR